MLYTCLFGSLGRDLRALLRSGQTDEEVSAFVGKVWRRRDDRYSEIRTDATRRQPKVEMSHIGG
jgi:cyclic pyranopterin phosphate synthase